MNGKESNTKESAKTQKFNQRLVNREPVFDRKLKVHRPRKTGVGKNPKWV